VSIKIHTTESKWHRDFCWRSGNSIKEKPLRGSQTQEFQYSETTRALPNLVSYLKGSSMESFTLGPTPKINFRCSAATAHLKWLQRKYHVSEQLWNSIPNSCSSQCLGATIYRLGAQMSVKQNIVGRRPDGQLCDKIFWKFCWEIFLV
jgi:hypothetical protein